MPVLSFQNYRFSSSFSPVFVLIIIFSCAFFSLQAQARTVSNANFQNWLHNSFWQQARRAGISRTVFKNSFRGISLNLKIPDLIIPGRKRRSRSYGYAQSEFRSPERYFRQSHLNGLVSRGRFQLKKWHNTLTKIENRYRVPARIIVAIWGKETAYGKAKLPYKALQVLASQAYLGRRKELFSKELIAALKIIQQGHISASRMKSSWAGAMGHPQFMPSAYLKYAVDFDGDGRKNIWSSVPDALASIANFLKNNERNPWQSHRPWGYESLIPKNFPCYIEGPKKGMSIRKWVRNGIKRVAKRKFPASELDQIGYKLMPAGRYGPAFIVSQNFYVLKEYNESDVYALFIGHLADRFKKNKKFIQTWKPIQHFSRFDVFKMQKKMVNKGYDVGGVDGLVGFKTRISIGEWQEKNKMRPTCFPDKKIFARM